VASTPVQRAAPRPTATRAARPAPPPKAAPKPVARRPKAVATKPKRIAALPIPAGRPRDASRLGLPLARLAPVTPDDRALTASLLVAAAVLLAASGAGSLTVGLSARQIARGGA
jgi:hypothetical protein